MTCPHSFDERSFFVEFFVGRGYLLENSGGGCGPLPKTLNLFKTIICYFSCPTYDLSKKIDTLFETNTSKLDTLFMTKMAKNKPFPIWPHTYTTYPGVLVSVSCT